MTRRMRVGVVIGLLATAAVQAGGDGAARPAARLDGYRGIWYANQATKDEYKYKYSGGLGTYCAKHIPVAIHAPAANKTFFVYGGTSARPGDDPAKASLLIMVSYYDHETGLVPRPAMLLDKKTTDAHDNPVLSIDEKGHLWVFAAAHGTARPAYIFRSAKPYDIEAFELVSETNFSYPQPWWFEGQGCLFLHTRYTKLGRELFAMSSPDGITWTEPQSLAAFGQGHYQISRRYKNKIATAFNYHPAKGGLNARTNLYYMESTDFGKTWRNAAGKVLDVPLKSPDNDARVFDYEGTRLVYLKDLNFDSRGHPLVLFVTSGGWEPGPTSGQRRWMIARWGGRKWLRSGLIRSDNNYDTGALYVEDRNVWRIIAPTDTGPQPGNPGGEIVAWISLDYGRSFHKQAITHHSEYNHTYVRRPVNADPGFYGYWADGHGRKPSPSRLYFCTRDGDAYRLPAVMDGEFAKPEKLPRPPGPFDVSTSRPASEPSN